MTPDDGTSLSKFIPATCPPSLISLAPYVDSVDSLLYHARDKIFVASNIFENVSSFIHGRNIVNDARLGEKIKLTVSKSNDRWKFVRKKKKKKLEKNWRKLEEVDLSSIFVNGNLSCFIRRASAKHLVFRGISFEENDGHSWRIPRCLPSVRRASFKSFLSRNDDKATAPVTEYLHENPSRIPIETFSPFHRGRDQIIINKRIHLVILGYVSLQIYAPFVDLSSRVSFQ